MKRTKINTQQLTGANKELKEYLESAIVNQQSAIDTVVRMFHIAGSGLNDKSKPLGSSIFLGQTGTGKTYFVEKFAEFVNKDSEFIRVDCGEFQYGHEIAKLIGSPPGYLGHRETLAGLGPTRINNLISKGRFGSGIILFDEIEKAHESLRALMLAVLDKAQMSMGDNSITRFDRMFIFMTSNLGAKELYEAQGYRVGFATKTNVTKDTSSDIVKEALRSQFTPEFINRIDNIITFNQLDAVDKRKIINKEIIKVVNRVAVAKAIHVEVTSKVVDWILAQPADPAYGARPLKRAIETQIVHPLASVLGSVTPGGAVEVDVANEEIVFFKLEKETKAAKAEA